MERLIPNDGGEVANTLSDSPEGPGDRNAQAALVSEGTSQRCLSWVQNINSLDSQQGGGRKPRSRTLTFAALSSLVEKLGAIAYGSSFQPETPVVVPDSDEEQAAAAPAARSSQPHTLAVPQLTTSALDTDSTTPQKTKPSKKLRARKLQELRRVLTCLENELSEPLPSYQPLTPVSTTPAVSAGASFPSGLWPSTFLNLTKTNETVARVTFPFRKGALPVTSVQSSSNNNSCGEEGRAPLNQPGLNAAATHPAVTNSPRGKRTERARAPRSPQSLQKIVQELCSVTERNCTLGNHSDDTSTTVVSLLDSKPERTPKARGGKRSRTARAVQKRDEGLLSLLEGLERMNDKEDMEKEIPQEPDLGEGESTALNVLQSLAQHQGSSASSGDTSGSCVNNVMQDGEHRSPGSIAKLGRSPQKSEGGWKGAPSPLSNTKNRRKLGAAPARAAE